MMGALSAVVLLGLVLLAVPVGVLWRQVRAARRAPVLRPQPAGVVAERAPVAVLIPAHNEAEVIEATLASVLPQLREQDVLWVVADNCTDDTAARARACGAHVSERTHSTLRGKSYALAHGVAALRAQTPRDWVVFIDADCQVHPGSLDELAWACQQHGRPVQALYLMEQPVPHEQQSARQRLAVLAWRLRNWVRPLGGRQLGWPCQLMGTGMGFPAWLLREELLTHGHITEDMKLGIDLASDGHAPLFLPSARVSSSFPISGAATRTQRTRWEHGHLDMLTHHMPGLLKAGWRSRNRALIHLALDLCVPPLALLAMLLSAGWLLALGLVVLGGSLLPLLLASLGLLGLAWSVEMARRGWAAEVISGRELLCVPLFVLAKLPIYLGFLLKRQTRWIRTDRR